jgi:hypothetical protein
MSFTYEPTTDIGRVRRTIPDKVEAHAVWSDEEIASFLADEDGWRRAAAMALEAMASDSVLVLQVIRVQNIQTDAAKMSDALLKRAETLRKQADEADAAGGEGFEIVSVAYDDFSYREILFGDMLRTR